MYEIGDHRVSLHPASTVVTEKKSLHYIIASRCKCPVFFSLPEYAEFNSS